MQKDKLIFLKEKDGLVNFDDYVKAKTKALVEFGYTNLTEDELRSQVEKILNEDSDLSVIGLFCKDDIDVYRTPQ